MFLTEEERKLTILGCRFCPMCYHADAVAAITCKESNSPRGRGLLLHGLDQGVLKWEDPEVSEIFYRSFTDGLPQEWCAGHYDHDELVIDARHRLYEKGLMPDAARQAAARVGSIGTPYQDPEKAIREFLKEEGVNNYEGSELLIFLGCTARSQKVKSSRSLFRILKRIKVPFQVLDPEECCGMILYKFGDFRGASAQAQKIAKRIAATQAKRLVALDANCYRMFMTRYRKFGAYLPDGLHVLHISEWLNDLLGKKNLALRTHLRRATYHDPCSLARFTRLHEPPRNVIRSLFAEFEEMEWNREKAHCCGGGGGMPITNPEIAQETARRRYEQIKKTGADVLVTSCPLCASMLKNAADPQDHIQDLIEVFADALEG